MALDIDLSRPVRSRAEQEQLVRAVAGAPAAEQETGYLEWKRELDLTRDAPRARAVIARTVLGFANRDPDIAAGAFGGCGYLLAGVSPGALTGVSVVDVAALDAQLTPYVGRAVQWRADYVTVDGVAVLIVTVEPPAWGDPPHPVRKGYQPAEGGPGWPTAPCSFATGGPPTRRARPTSTCSPAAPRAGPATSSQSTCARRRT